jgi:hypothetical protein
MPDPTKNNARPIVPEDPLTTYPTSRFQPSELNQKVIAELIKNPGLTYTQGYERVTERHSIAERGKK